MIGSRQIGFSNQMCTYMGGYLVIILPFNFPRIFFNFAFLRNSSSFAHYVPAGVDPAENFLLGVLLTSEVSHQQARCAQRTECSATGERSEPVAAAITSSRREAARASAAGVRGRSPRKILDKFTPKIAWRSNLVLMHTFLQPIWDISAENHCHRKYENKLTSLHDQIKFVLNGQKAPGRVQEGSGAEPPENFG